MAWCRETRRHKLNGCCLRSLSPHGLTRLQLSESSWFSTDLFKLMYTEDSPRVSPMWADLLSETSGHAGIFNGEVSGRYPLISVVGSDGLFRGGNQVLLIHRFVIGLLATLANDLQQESNKLSSHCCLSRKMEFILKVYFPNSTDDLSVLSTSSKIGLMCVPQNSTDDKSTLVQVMNLDAVYTHIWLQTPLPFCRAPLF